jgi:putative acetyltransferase
MSQKYTFGLIMEDFVIRLIAPEDDAAVAKVIRAVLVAHKVPKVGTAYADPELDCMFATYARPRAAYFVVEKAGQILGGAGIAQLQNEDASICELQKMYFLPEARGVGLGKAMIDKCLAAAKELGYEKCYLETMPYMEAAQKLYRKSGFDYICEPMGNTGHNACPVWMIKEL